MNTPSFTADRISQRSIESVIMSIAAPFAEDPRTNFAHSCPISFAAWKVQCGDFGDALRLHVRNTSSSTFYSREING